MAEKLTAMTWSLAARNAETREFGVAVVSGVFAVGARVPFAASNTGAIATQALINPYFGIDGLDLLSRDRSADQVLDILQARDAGRAHRQVHLIDREGRSAAFTGECCLAWCGHVLAEGLSVAGNMLSGPCVLEETRAAYFATSKLPFARRLISAMQAGNAAQGEGPGKRSASLLIVGENEWSALDLRVDDHADPVRELERLERVSHQEWVGYRRFVPTRACPAGVTDHNVIDGAVGHAMVEL